MNFRLFFESTYVYTPPKNKGHLMFDFYLLTALASIAIPKARKIGEIEVKGPEPHQVRLSEDDVSIIEHAFTTVITHLRKHLLQGLYYSIVREMSHIANDGAVDEDYWGEWKPNRDYSAGLDEFLARYKDEFGPEFAKVHKEIHRLRNIKRPKHRGGQTYSEEGPLIARAAIKVAKQVGISPPEMVKIASRLFEMHPWHDEYGGEAWRAIAQGWLMLYNSKSIQEQAVAIDHLYDLQHNSGSLLTKMKEYVEEAGSSWIDSALDFKRNIKDFSEILPYISPGLKKHALRVLHKTQGPKERSTVNEKARQIEQIKEIFENRGYTQVTTSQPSTFNQPNITKRGDIEHTYFGLANWWQLNDSELYDFIIGKIRRLISEEFPNHISKIMELVEEKIRNSTMFASSTLKTKKVNEDIASQEWEYRFTYDYQIRLPSVESIVDRGKMGGGAFEIAQPGASGRYRLPYEPSSEVIITISSSDGIFSDDRPKDKINNGSGTGTFDDLLVALEQGIDRFETGKGISVDIRRRSNKPGAPMI